MHFRKDLDVAGNEGYYTKAKLLLMQIKSSRVGWTESIFVV